MSFTNAQRIKPTPKLIKKQLINGVNINALTAAAGQQIVIIGLDKVETKPSIIHGNGVFARMNIQKNDLVTFYPVDIVEYYPGGKRKEKIPGKIYFSKRLKRKNNLTNIINYDNHSYACHLNENFTLIADPDFKNPTHLGHLINDVGIHDSTEQSIEKYKETLDKTNCQIYQSNNDLKIVVIATKNIEKGNELFLHYGVGYWKTYNELNKN